MSRTWEIVITRHDNGMISVFDGQKNPVTALQGNEIEALPKVAEWLFQQLPIPSGREPVPPKDEVTEVIKKIEDQVKKKGYRYALVVCPGHTEPGKAIHYFGYSADHKQHVTLMVMDLAHLILDTIRPVVETRPRLPPPPVGYT